MGGLEGHDLGLVVTGPAELVEQRPARSRHGTGGITGRPDRRPGSLDHAERPGGAGAGRVGGPGRRLGTHGPWRGEVAVVGVGGERPQDLAHGRDTVEQGVVDLGEHRDPVALDALDQVQLPQWPVTIQRVRVHVGAEREQFADAAGGRQRQVAHVVGDLDLVGLEGEGAETPVGFLQGEVEGGTRLAVRHGLCGDGLQPVLRGVRGTREQAPAG